MKYAPRHLAAQPTRPRQTSRPGLVAAATVALVLLGATPAHAQTTRVARIPAQVTVARGDTLTGLAYRWCGSASAYRNLAAGNGISNPNLILAGQTLKLTCSATVRATTTASRGAARGSASAPAPSGWTQPIPGGGRSSCYGPRNGGFHAGTDITAAPATPIRAVHGGTVAVNHDNTGAGGYYIVLNHGGNIFSAYMHLRTRSPLGVGTRVTAGQTIGYVGATGDATGPHLHFEIHNGLWHKISPSAFMRSHGVAVGC